MARNDIKITVRIQNNLGIKEHSKLHELQKFSQNKAGDKINYAYVETDISKHSRISKDIL